MAQLSTGSSNRPDRLPVSSGIEAVSIAAASLAAQEAPEDRIPAVEVQGFCFSYVEGKPILDQVDWTVEAGSFTLFVGGTGTGKTTLIRNMKPEIAPKGICSGSIRIFGIPVEELDAKASAELVGYVSQSPENQIVCDTVWHELAFGLENLGIPQETMHRRVAEVAHFFGIEPWLDHSTDALSGGQKQLMTLASVLALRPRLLLLDEPTSQLDPVAAKNFLHALFRINRELGLTVVMVTHDPEMVADYATSLRELRDMRIKEHDIQDYRQEIRRLAASVDYTKAAPPLVEGYGQLETVVSLKDTHVRYGKDQPFVLRGCDLQVKTGIIHALVGGNGSGKTTLLNTVAGTMKVDRGRVQNLLKGSQALLPQNPKTIFVRDSVQEELEEWQASAGYTDEDIQEVLERFHLTQLVDQHPYDLSGGQQQALAFAKIALTKPRLLLMDEPTKGLDVVYRFLMADNLMELKRQGVTIVMVTHDLSFAARVSDVTSLLFDGQVTCTQPTGEFFQENLFYRPTIDAFFCTWERDWEQAADTPVSMGEDA